VLSIDDCFDFLQLEVDYHVSRNGGNFTYPRVRIDVLRNTQTKEINYVVSASLSTKGASVRGTGKSVESAFNMAAKSVQQRQLKRSKVEPERNTV